MTGRHRLTHLAISTNLGMAAPCECELDTNHPQHDAYRICGECGAVYLTEKVLVDQHLAWFADQDHIPERYKAVVTDADHYGSSIYACPGCTHDF